MKNILILFVVVFLTKFIIGQELNKNDFIEKQESEYSQFIKYSDPSFPVLNEKEKSESEIGNYKRSLEEYAKLHPPVPEYSNTGNLIEDEANYKIILDNWYANNPYFPRFIQYHLFHKNLTIENDNMFYKEAVKVWFDHNPQIAIEKNK
ncbi:MAG: hypothetical protein ABIJ97_14700 [Bacteroidota bacterium]